MFEAWAKEYIDQSMRWRRDVTFKEPFTQRVFGDYGLWDEESNRCIRVDVKVDQSARFTGNFPIELEQCVDRGERGWFYELQQCDQIWYAQVSTDRQPVPYGFWRISLERLRTLLGCMYWRTWRTVVTEKGYGVTELKLAPLNELVSIGVAVSDDDMMEFCNKP
jgi:hypothetical protein